MSEAPTAEFTPHVRTKRQRRRQEILHAALDTVREKGYHATTLDDIAERLGIRKAALYYYFPDKDSILFACHQESLAELDRMIEQSATCCKTAKDRLAFLIKEHVRVMTDTLEGSPLAFEVPALSLDRRDEIIEGRDRYEHLLRDLVAEGVKDGDFREVDPKIAVFAILGAINWIARWYRPEGEAHAPELGEQFSDYLLKGLMDGL